MQATDERLLLERAGACDEAALSELYDRYAGKIYSYIFYRVGDPDLAEDLTASVFIKVLDALQSSKGWQSSFSGWLYRIAHNAVVDYFRRQEKEKVLPLDERIVAAFDDPVAAAERSLSAEAIRAGRIGRLVYMRGQLSCWYPPIPGAWRQDRSQAGGRWEDEDQSQDGFQEAGRSVRTSLGLLRKGQRIRHPMFGVGRLLWIDPLGRRTRAGVRFANGDTKTLILEAARVQILDTD